jgi:hypothetical protein
MVDERAIPPAGRIGETEDLIGSVFVKDGKVSLKPCLDFRGSFIDYRSLRRHMTLNPCIEWSRVMDL